MRLAHLITGRNGLWAALTLALALASPGALAQPADCASALAAAEARYVEGSFDAVEPLLLPCLDGSAQSVPAYRLIALAGLRQGEIVAAKLAVLRIFAARPDYAPDAVQEPPDYVALVQTVRDQLAVAPEPTPASPERERTPLARVVVREPVTRPESALVVPSGPARVPPAPAISAPSQTEVAYRAWIGAGSYGGERGAAGDGGLDEFTRNAGIAAGLGGTVSLQSWLKAYADLAGNFYPTLPTDKGDNFVFEPVEEASLSSYVYSVTVGFQLVPFRVGGVAPYLLVGGGGAVGGGGRVGATATLGGGLEATLDPTTAVFAEGHGTLVAPERALDAASWPDSGTQFDLFSGVRLGLRYRIGS